jgi:hypothetical protein
VVVVVVARRLLFSRLLGADIDFREVDEALVLFIVQLWCTVFVSV